MKNLILLLLLVFSYTKLFSQCEIDQNVTKPGFYPSPAQGDFQAIVDSNFSQVIQFKSITDTVVSGFQIGIDSVKVLTIQGLPNGITYSLNPNKTLKGGENACLLLWGIPVAGTEKGGEELNGRYNVQIDYALYLTILGNPQTITQSVNAYSIAVKAIMVGVNENEKNVLFNAFPNPANEQINLSFGTENSGAKNISIISSAGKLVYAGTHSETNVSLDLREYNSGLYIVRAQTSKGIQQVPLIVK